MTFIELYKQAVHAPSPRQVFIDKVAKATNRPTRTVEGWVRGARKPKEPTQRLIGEVLGVDWRELFPK